MVQKNEHLNLSSHASTFVLKLLLWFLRMDIGVYRHVKYILFTTRIVNDCHPIQLMSLHDIVTITYGTKNEVLVFETELAARKPKVKASKHFVRICIVLKQFQSVKWRGTTPLLYEKQYQPVISHTRFDLTLLLLQTKRDGACREKARHFYHYCTTH